MSEMMVIDWQYLPTEVDEDDLSFTNNPEGGWTAHIIAFPSILEVGESKEEVLQKIKTLVKNLNILR